jgi:RNA-directed DNA polymerase
LSNLVTPINIQRLQKALHVKAKAEPEYRFYALYDKIYRMDILTYAYACCKANKGAAGVDGQTFDDVEEYGKERWLGELAESLKEETYKPEAVRRVYIPKSNGKKRPLGIACISDRVRQMATMLVLEPIFEADLQPEQYAYRAGKNALEAVNHVHRLLNTGYHEVVDADLTGYFDNIPHAELMKSMARRITDKRVLHLIKMWLHTPVEEVDQRGNKHRTTQNRDNKVGIMQGSPISPLLSNVYMRRFILGWKKLGLENKLRARIVNYADDLVICCKYGGASKALTEMRQLMERLKLQVNEEKTHICRVGEGSFDFLGYTLGLQHSTKTGRIYIGSRPSKKSVAKIIESISLETDKRSYGLEAKILVGNINSKLAGWSNYFKLGAVSKAYNAIDEHTRTRLRRWLCKKHKEKIRGYERFPNRYLYEELGMIELPKRTKGLPWAKA